MTQPNGKTIADPSDQPASRARLIEAVADDRAGEAASA